MPLSKIDVEKTCMNIRDLCDRRDVSIRDIQAALRLSSPQAVYRWYQADGIPSIDDLIALADLFDVSVYDILVVKPPGSE
ncbi:MAG: helix-turn-helix transcriptional regulator [Clostridiales bacterium]|nr:helix-turn-helix transcriptional regulator [Clostridiales bacterium]